MKRTALYDEHKKLNARIVDYAGWDMPVQYTGIIHEHKAVRESVGVFDVSHMCIADISGDDYSKFLQLVTINDVDKLAEYQAQYSMILDEEGNVLDDIIVSKMDSFMRVVINSGNEEKIKNWFALIIKKNSFNVNILYRDDLSIIAVQGPKSIGVLEKIFNTTIELKSFRLTEFNWKGNLIDVSRTGYTGELGFEVFVDNELAASLWQAILDEGAIPAGLGARDTLRIEAGLPLYGQEIVENITAYDMGYGWVVKLLKGDFIGKDTLEKANKKKRLFGCFLNEKGVLRGGYEVVGHGKLTSGTYSPVFNAAIGMFYSNNELKENDQLNVIIRGKEVSARVIELPFIKR